MGMLTPPFDSWRPIYAERAPNGNHLFTSKGPLDGILFMYKNDGPGWTMCSHMKSDKLNTLRQYPDNTLSYEEICDAVAADNTAGNLSTLIRLHDFFNNGKLLPKVGVESKEVLYLAQFIVGNSSGHLENKYFTWKHEDDANVVFCTESKNFLGHGAEEFSHGKTSYEALLKRLQETNKLHLIDEYLDSVNQPNHQSNSGNDNKMSYNDTPPNDSSEKDRKELAKKQMKRAGGALARGAGLAAIDAAGDKMLDFAQAKFGDSPGLQLVLSTNEGREIVKVALAMLLQTLAYQTDLPKAEHVISLTEKQLELSGLKVLAPHLKDLLTLAGSLGTLGEMASTDPLRAFMPDSETEGSILDFSPQATKVPVEG